MAFVTLEDMTGSVECLVFPKVYTLLRPYLAEDSIVVAEGRLSLREDEEPKLILNTAQTMEDAKAQAAGDAAESAQADKPTDTRKLFIKFCLGKDYLLDRIKPVLAAHRGSVPVCIYIEETKSTAMAPRTLWVTPEDALLNNLRDMLGHENVVLK